MTDYKSWRLVLNATEAKQIVVDFLDSGADTKAPHRSVLAFMGRT